MIRSARNSVVQKLLLKIYFGDNKSLVETTTESGPSNLSSSQKSLCSYFNSRNVGRINQPVVPAIFKKVEESVVRHHTPIYVTSLLVHFAPVICINVVPAAKKVAQKAKKR